MKKLFTILVTITCITGGIAKGDMELKERNTFPANPALIAVQEFISASDTTVEIHITTQDLIDITGISHILIWDPNVLRLNDSMSVKNVNEFLLNSLLPARFFVSSDSTINFIWVPVDPTTFPQNDTLYSLCFDIINPIGANGTVIREFPFNERPPNLLTPPNQIRMNNMVIEYENINTTIIIDQNVPVELVNFDVQVQKEGVGLYWQTASEIDNFGFQIEKSKNGKTWKNIAFVEASGNSIETKNYRYLDLSPFDGLNYYRLRQIDFNGSFHFSSKKVAKWKSSSWKSFSVYPNPANNLLYIDYSGLTEIKRITCYDSYGHQFYISGEEIKELEVESFPKGIYILRIATNDDVFEKTFVKQ